MCKILYKYVKLNTVSNISSNFCLSVDWTRYDRPIEGVVKQSTNKF